MTANSEQEKNGFMHQLRKDWMAVALIAASFAAGAMVYPHLPDMVPSHWNIKGQVDGYSSKFWGGFGIPLLMAGIYLLMTVLPKLDPRRENYSRFRGAYSLMKLLFAAFFAWLYAVILFNSLGLQFPVDRAVIPAVGLLFMVIGNVMGQFRHNYFVGIKTPWTLASQEVWQKTHRLGSRVWVVSGMAMAISGFILGGQKGFPVFAAALGASIIVPVVYSWILYKKIHQA